MDKVNLTHLYIISEIFSALFLLFGNALGEFGIVYKAIVDGWKSDEVEQVAVKTLKGEPRHCINNNGVGSGEQVSSVAVISKTWLRKVC